MTDAKKKPATLILDSMKPMSEAEKPEENENGDQQDESIGQQAAADDLLSAISAKDSAGIVSAIKSLIAMCGE